MIADTISKRTYHQQTNHADEILIEGMETARNQGWVTGWFYTVSDREVRVQVNYLVASHEFLFIIGSQNTINHKGFNRLITSNPYDARDYLADCIGKG